MSDISKIEKIQAEVKYEEALLQIRKLRKFEKGTSEYLLRKELVEFVLSYEKVHYPYGENNFDEWSEKKQNDEYYNERQVIFKEVNKILEQKKQFREARVAEIKQKLKEKELKQQYLTELFGIKKSYVSQLMNSKKRFTLSNISQLHYKLGIPFEKLIPRPELLQKSEFDENFLL